MSTQLILVPILFVTVVILIRAEVLKIRWQSYIFKPLSTLLLIAVALLSFQEPGHNPVYSNGILIGLIFSLGGDVALLFQDRRRSFIIGLALFLVAHIVYIAVFVILGCFTPWDLLSAVLITAAAAGFYRLIAPNLGSMKFPVIAYIAVISVMLNRAIAVFTSPVFSLSQAWMIALGALLFSFSDILLAATRFWRVWKYNRISLALYYGGQLLLALAASYFG